MIKVFIVIVAIFTLNLFAAPSWFANRDLPLVNNQIIGYGEDINLNQAISNAKIDIASQINATVSSISATNEIDNNQKQSRLALSISEVSVKAEIVDVFHLKQEKFQDKFYVALAYENIPIYKKFINKLENKILKNESQNIYLEKTPFVKDLNKALNYKLNYKLLRKDGLWYISYNNIIQSLDSRAFEELFVTIYSDILSIEIFSKNPILYHDDSFSFKINSKKEGFISIFEVDEKGSVTLILKNENISKNKAFNFPKKSDDFDLVASTLDEDKDTFSIFIVVINEQVDDYIDNFVEISYSLNNNEHSKKFNRLIEYINNRTFTTKRVDIRAKK
ncbi:LPP20 family lipoprotein [Arcobacter porcinus]|uniref:LPP20 family lipoprotein n=1 Tax=Arcobacter porcinus TaxID=1935204 RepID=A0A5C2HAV3_9BACT|nr:LPP20 family lipoprotein [Arcobacter porcinus]OCL88301.1 hypothetical protein AAX27_02015 [Aliarcobacter thereius]QEP39919.1 LPP20 family lipoprotein [Arcobacter porcinus]